MGTKSAQQKILERTHQYGEREKHTQEITAKKNQAISGEGNQNKAQNPRNDEN